MAALTPVRVRVQDLVCAQVVVHERYKGENLKVLVVHHENPTPFAQMRRIDTRKNKPE